MVVQKQGTGRGKGLSGVQCYKAHLPKRPISPEELICRVEISDVFFKKKCIWRSLKYKMYG